MPTNIQRKSLPSCGSTDQAEEAASFYTSIFKNSEILTVAHYGDEGAKASGRPEGTVMTVGVSA